MDDKIFDKIEDVDLKKKMEDSYIDYAMSVIAARALPDVRDGLKPVQRRVLYSMIELNNGPDKPHRKSARIVGDTMGKYHPHGDSSIYGALVNMAQDWSTRYPLVDGHGNFGSMDGDGAAAMRYTEARLSKISMELLADINKNTVDFVPNFDDTEKEPVVFNKRGRGQGIAVYNAEILDAVEKQVHLANSGGQRVDLLPEDRNIAPFFPLFFQISNRGDQHTGAAAGGVIDGLSRFRAEHFCHQMDDRPVGVKLLRRVAAVIREFLDEVLIPLSKLILRAVCDGERPGTEMLQQVLQ